MTEKTKKFRIYKFASEYNLSSDAIVEFLNSKGHNVKSHMSPLNDEMLADINAHFKKDMEKAEKHYRKISEFQKKRADKAEEIARKDENTQDEVVVEETEPQKLEEEIEAPKEAEAPEIEEAEEKVAPVVFEEPVVEETIEEVAEEKVEEVIQITETTQDVKTETPVEEKENDKVRIEEKVEEPVVANEEETVREEDVMAVEEEPEVKKAPKEEEGRIFKTKSELELERRNRGLKIIGKIDLDKKKRKKKRDAGNDEKAEKKEGNGKVRDDRNKRRNNKPNRENAPQDDNKKTEVKVAPTTQESAEAAELKRKKKKKKLKSKGKPEGNVEETVKSKKVKKVKKFEVDKKQVSEAIKRTMHSIDESNAVDRSHFRKKKKKEKLEIQEKLEEQKALDRTKLKVTEYIAVNEIANLMNVSVSEVISKCIGLGMMVSINQRLDWDTIALVAEEFGFEVELEEEFTSDVLEDVEDKDEELLPRSPVVTIMGHVDHGKTSLLDYIRRENVVAGEAGGITQHIGAYRVELESGKSITFLDTPGHEAFTAMRARGAKITDIVVLIVAADDAVMPQTVEAINHSLAAGVPIIVAINKIDKPAANTERIRQQLADRNILVEDWGGKYQCVEVSAKSGLNIDLLLEKILLEAEMLELKANPDRNARGAVVESQMEVGRGITATVLIEKGTMTVGDPFVAGNYHGRVRAMFDERNNKLDSVGPATPALVLGFEGLPQAGDSFIIVDSEKEARDVANKRQQIKREQDHRQVKLITLDEIAMQISQGGVKELALIVKGDVDGSVEALSDSLMKLSNKEVVVRVIHKGVGGITEGDVLLAAASSAIIVGFHVRPNNNARKTAEVEKVDIRLYNVIYDAINEVKSALEGMLSPVVSEELVGTIDIRETFKVPKIGTVAGCYVTDGKVSRVNKIRLFRDGVVIYEGELATLKRFKDDVKEVMAGYECGLNISNFNDIKIGDVIESYKLVETKKTLE